MPKARNDTLAMIWRCARHQNPEIEIEYLPYGTAEQVTMGSENLPVADHGVSGAYRDINVSFWEMG